LLIGAGTDMSISGPCNYCTKKGMPCIIHARSQACTCIVCKRHHVSCVQSGKQGMSQGQTASPKREQVAVTDVIVILEGSEEETAARTLVLRKRPDKPFFNFKLDKDGKMAPLPVNPFWPFWQWSKVVEKCLEDLQIEARVQRDETREQQEEAREQRKELKELWKEVKELREKVVELEKKVKE